MTSQSQDSLRLQSKAIRQNSRAQIVQQQRSTLEQLEFASSYVTFRDQR